jgi:hypothetical protein
MEKAFNAGAHPLDIVGKSGPKTGAGPGHYPNGISYFVADSTVLATGE